MLSEDYHSYLRVILRSLEDTVTLLHRTGNAGPPFAGSWSQLNEQLVDIYKTGDILPSKIQTCSARVGWARKAIASFGESLSGDEAQQARRWVLRLQAAVGDALAAPAAANVEVKPKIKSESEITAKAGCDIIVIDSDDEAEPVGAQAAVDTKSGLVTPPLSAAGKGKGRARDSASLTPALKQRAPTPEPSNPKRRQIRRSAAPELPVKRDDHAEVSTSEEEDDSEADQASDNDDGSPAAARDFKLPLVPRPISATIVTNVFDLSLDTFDRPSPADFAALQALGHFKNVDFAGNRQGTLRRVAKQPRLWRFALDTTFNLHINTRDPVPAQMDRKQSSSLPTIRKRYKSGDTIGLVAKYPDPDTPGKFRWKITGRYKVKGFGSAPAGDFGRVGSGAARNTTLEILMKYLTDKTPWITSSCHLMGGGEEGVDYGAIIKEARSAKAAGGEKLRAFKARLARDLDNAAQDQYLVYTVLEYAEPYDSTELAGVLDRREKRLEEERVWAAKSPEEQKEITEARKVASQLKKAAAAAKKPVTRQKKVGSGKGKQKAVEHAETSEEESEDADGGAEGDEDEDGDESAEQSGSEYED